MKLKRVISILVAVMMLAAAVFVMPGCSTTNNEENNEGTKEIVVLNMYIITDGETKEQEALKVQQKINQELLPVEKTILNINYLTADEYWEKVETALEETEDMEESVKIKGTENYSFNDMIELIYSEEVKAYELTGPQIDIFVVDDYDKYVELVDDGKVAELTLDTLETFIYPSFLEVATVNAGVYGVPSNALIEEGEFTYLIINKTLLDKHGKKLEDLNIEDLSGKFVRDYLTLINNSERANGVCPMSGPCEMSGIDVYDNAFASKGTFEKSGVYDECFVLSNYAAYTGWISAMRDYEALGFFNNAGCTKYAIEIETSKTLNMEKEWVGEDGDTYIRYLYDVPRADENTAFTSVMCVSATSPNKERALEVIRLFNTDSELANLLQYGIESDNYVYEPGEGFKEVGTGYVMDNKHTGNTYIKLNHDQTYVKNCIDNNLNTTVAPFIGFDASFDSAVTEAEYNCIRNVVEAGMEKAMNTTTTEEFENEIKKLNEELVFLGFAVESGSYLGVFGNVVNQYKQKVQPFMETYRMSDAVLNYNNYFFEEPVVEEPVTEEVAEEVTEEVTEEVAEEVTEEVTEEVAEEVAEEVTEEVAEEVAEETAEQAE